MLVWTDFPARPFREVASKFTGTPELEKGKRQAFVEGHRQNFNHVKILTWEFKGSVAFFLSQILSYRILGIASVKIAKIAFAL